MTENALDTLIEVSPGETRVALVDQDGILQSLDIARANAPSLVGAVILGRLRKIDKSLGVGFVDIGDGPEALLPKPQKVAEGAAIVVQVTRDGRDGKGPAVTLRPAVEGRYLAYAPDRGGLHWAREVGKGKDRARLEEFADALLGRDSGFTIKGPAVIASPDLLEVEAEALKSRFAAFEEARKSGKAPTLIEAAPDAALRAVMDAPPEGRIAIDDRNVFTAMKKRAEESWPDLVPGLTYFDGEHPLFEETEVDEQIDQALSRIYTMRGGGTLVFDRTEAMTVIDVNTAGGQDRASSDDAAMRFNKRAAEEIIRQISIRNLSGLIVIDFLKMKNRALSKQLVDYFRAKAKVLGNADVLGVTAAGLVEMTRQRTGLTLADRLMTTARTVELPSSDTVACAIMRAAIRLKGGGRPVAEASPETINHLRNEYADALEDVARRLGRPLEFRPGRDALPPEVAMER